MRNQVIIATVLAMSLLAATSGEDRSEKRNQTILNILTIPAESLFPGSPALQDIARQTNLLTVLCQSWTAAETPEQRIRLLRLAVDLGKSQSRAKRSHFRLADDRVAEALVEALDVEIQDIRSTAADLFGKEFDETTVRRFGPRILAIIRKRKNTDAILLLGRTGMQEAGLLLQEENAFRAASERATELALARLGNKEYEAKFIGEFKSAKRPGDKLRLARDLAYVASESACRTLAEDLRNPEKVETSGLCSVRVFIIEALSMAYPDEQILWRPHPLSEPQDDSYYENIERWAETKFNISWSQPRPPFFYMMDLPIKGTTSIP